MYTRKRVNELRNGSKLRCFSAQFAVQCFGIMSFYKTISKQLNDKMCTPKSLCTTLLSLPQSIVHKVELYITKVIKVFVNLKLHNFLLSR